MDCLYLKPWMDLTRLMFVASCDCIETNKLIKRLYQNKRTIKECHFVIIHSQIFEKKFHGFQKTINSKGRISASRNRFYQENKTFNRTFLSDRHCTEITKNYKIFKKLPKTTKFSKITKNGYDEKNHLLKKN